MIKNKWGTSKLLQYIHIIRISVFVVFCSTIFHPAEEFFTFKNEDVERLQYLGLCSALRAFEQGGIFIVPHLL
jgi:hypothetical protein